MWGPNDDKIMCIIIAWIFLNICPAVGILWRYFVGQWIIFGGLISNITVISDDNCRRSIQSVKYRLGIQNFQLPAPWLSDLKNWQQIALFPVLSIYRIVFFNPYLFATAMRWSGRFLSIGPDLDLDIYKILYHIFTKKQTFLQYILL
jgi:hypothetical protein